MTFIGSRFSSCFLLLSSYSGVRAGTFGSLVFVESDAGVGTCLSIRSTSFSHAGAFSSTITKWGFIRECTASAYVFFGGWWVVAVIVAVEVGKEEVSEGELLIVWDGRSWLLWFNVVVCKGMVVVF